MVPVDATILPVIHSMQGRRRVWFPTGQIGIRILLHRVYRRVLRLVLVLVWELAHLLLSRQRLCCFYGDIEEICQRFLKREWWRKSSIQYQHMVRPILPSSLKMDLASRNYHQDISRLRKNYQPKIGLDDGDDPVQYWLPSHTPTHLDTKCCTSFSIVATPAPTAQISKPAVLCKMTLAYMGRTLFIAPCLEWWVIPQIITRRDEGKRTTWGIDIDPELLLPTDHSSNFQCLWVVGVRCYIVRDDCFGGHGFGGARAYSPSWSSMFW